MTKKDLKKIILVSNTSWSVYNFRKNLMRALAKHGYKVIFCANRDGYTDMLIKEGFSFIPINSTKGKNPINDLKLLYELYSIYKRERPLLVLHFRIKAGIYGSLAAGLSGIKAITTITGLGYSFINNRPIFQVVKFLYRISLNLSSRIFFQNKDDMNFFIKNKIVSERKAFLVNGSGVNVNYFCNDFCKNAEVKENKEIFLFIGRLLWDKGVGELVQAADIVKKHRKQTEFWLLGPLGKGNPADIKESTIKEWEKRGSVKYFGDTNDVRPFLCKCDALILPSYREGMPRSILEAMAMRIPVITTNTTGCRDLVEDGKNGFLVPIKEPKALAEAILKFINTTHGQKEKMGRINREKVLKKYNENDVFDLYIGEIGKLY